MQVLVQFILFFLIDSVLERRVLREDAFPKLRDHCQHMLGMDVRVRTFLFPAAAAKLFYIPQKLKQLFLLFFCFL